MLQKILIIANFVIVLAGVGLVAYSHFMLKPEPTDQAAETLALQNEAEALSQLKPVPIKKFVVNLHSRSSRLRYLDLEMNVLTFHPNQKELVKTNEHIFKDVVIQVASELEPSELDTVTGKILLEKRIKDRANEKLKAFTNGPVVKQIYFSGFVVQ